MTRLLSHEILTVHKKIWLLSVFVDYFENLIVKLTEEFSELGTNDLTELTETLTVKI